MANGATRWVSILIALLIGVGLGWLLCSRPAARPVYGSNSILVGPTAKQLTIPTLEISIKNHDVVWWNSRDPGKDLLIEFEEQAFEDPKQGKYGNFRVKCQGPSCFSGPIWANAEPKKYKYWQVLVDPSDPTNEDKEDGWIVIQR